MRRLAVLMLWVSVLPQLQAAEPGASLEVAFGQAEITPESLEQPAVWLAGYAMNRRATGIHDPLYARCVLLRHEARTFALISLDLIGLQYPAVQRIRAQLADYTHVTVSSTHNHEGPDVIGVWGRSPVHRGVDDRYVDRVISRDGGRGAGSGIALYAGDAPATEPRKTSPCCTTAASRTSRTASSARCDSTTRRADGSWDFWFSGTATPRRSVRATR